jgi:Uma2 family endonuclease
MFLTVQDLEKLQSEYPDWRMELVDGEIIVMSPSGYESEEIATNFSTQLNNWVRPRQIGRVAGSSAGFILPNSNTRAPDVSFVRAERLKRSPRSFAQLAPDLAVEVKSPSDRLAKLREKIQDFLNAGTQVGILINPETKIIEIYRSGQDTVILGDFDILTIPDLLPGWQIAVSDLWALEFD